MVLLLLMVSTRGECVSNSGWWVAMHLVLTLGKRRQIARLEWERGEGGFSGRQGPVDIWPCVLRSPHGPLLRPLLSSFSSSFVVDFTIEKHERPTALLDTYVSSTDGKTAFRCWRQEQLELIFWMVLSLKLLRALASTTLSSDAIEHPTMSSEPPLLLLAAALSDSTHNMIRAFVVCRWSMPVVCFVTRSHLPYYIYSKCKGIDKQHHPIQYLVFFSLRPGSLNQDS